MRDDTRALIGKEFREQRTMGLVWLAVLLFAPFVSAGLFVVGVLSGRSDASWAEYLLDVGVWAPARYRDLLLQAAVFAWGGIRVFHRETEAGTHAWLRTMPVPEYVISWSKALAAAVYVVVANATLLLVQFGAVAVAGAGRMPPGTHARLVEAFFGQTAALCFAFVLGAIVGVYWRPRSVVRAAAIFAGVWMLLLVYVLVVELPGDSLPSLTETAVTFGPQDSFDWTMRGVQFVIWSVVFLGGLGWEFGRRPVIRYRA